MEKGNQETAVLISIRPEWCQKIADGEKTVEVRKTRPTIEPPFKCYIYETVNARFSRDILGKEYYHGTSGRGMVIGEFICRKIDSFVLVGSDLKSRQYRMISKNGYCLPVDYAKMGLSEIELVEYGKGKLLYGWNISDLIIYDKTKRLDEFKSACDSCRIPILPFRAPPCDKCPGRNITNAPQSWCYVDELPPFEGEK